MLNTKASIFSEIPNEDALRPKTPTAQPIYYWSWRGPHMNSILCSNCSPLLSPSLLLSHHPSIHLIHNLAAWPEKRKRKRRQFSTAGREQGADGRTGKRGLQKTGEERRGRHAILHLPSFQTCVRHAISLSVRLKRKEDGGKRAVLFLLQSHLPWPK